MLFYPLAFLNSSYSVYLGDSSPLLCAAYASHSLCLVALFLCFIQSIDFVEKAVDSVSWVQELVLIVCSFKPV